MGNSFSQSTVTFQPPKSFGSLVNCEQFDEVVNVVSKKMDKGKDFTRDTADKDLCHAYLKRLLSSIFTSDGIQKLYHGLLPHEFSDNYLERLYSLNLNHLMRQRYMMVNTVGLVLLLVMWVVATVNVPTFTFREYSDAEGMGAFNVISTATCVLLTMSLFTYTPSLGHLRERSCYASYTMIIGLWTIWNYLAPVVFYSNSRHSFHMYMMEAVRRVSAVVFGLAVILVMNLYLSLRSCRTWWIHMVHIIFHTTGTIMETQMKKDHGNTFHYGQVYLIHTSKLATVLKLLLNLVPNVVLFFLGCRRDSALRHGFLSWAASQANNADESKPAKENDKGDLQCQYQLMGSCVDLLEHIQCMDDSSDHFKQCLFELNSVQKSCFHHSSSSASFFSTLLTHENSAEMCPLSSPSYTDVYGSKGSLPESHLEQTLESHVSLAFSVPYKSLSQEELEAIAPTDNSLLGYWDFNILEYFRTESSPFISIGYGLLYNYSDAFKVDKQVVINLLSVMESLYRDVPYHNRIHGAKVAQKLFCLAKYTGLYDKMSTLEQAGMIVAALAHDVGHPARNNAFFVRSNHPVSQMYNNTSVLEHFHAASALRLLSIPGCRIFSDSDYDTIKPQIVELILATDNVDHFKVISRFEKKCTSSDLCLDDPQDRCLTSKILIKGADIAAPTTPWENSLEWVGRLMAEFYSQGDEEEHMGMPISALCDRRHHSQVAKAQAAFLKLVVSPLYRTISLLKDSTDMERLLSRLEENAERWQQMQLEGGKLPCYTFENYRSMLDLSWVSTAK